MLHERLQGKVITPGVVFLALIVLAGGVAIVYRMTTGLGAVTNMSDQWPWGLWKAVNVLVVIALGAGGFTSAALIYIFCGEKYHAFARSGVLFALLCYASAGFSLVFDIGIPYRIINPIWMWPPEHSILFEVAWCVMLYQSVLLLELLPSVFDRFKLNGLAGIWRALVPPYTVVAITFFTYIMTHSWNWTIAAFVFFAFLAIVVPRIVSRPATTPIILVMFGIILSCCHQSSLGSLFLLMPDKLSSLWWTPALPFNFILSAMAVGLCMVIVERFFSAKAFGRPVEADKLARLGGMAAVLFWIYIIVRLGDMAARGNLTGIGDDPKIGIFGVEMAMAVVPALALLSPGIRRNPGSLAFFAVIAIAGVILNRLDVCILGMTIPGPSTYVPTGIEVLICGSVFAGILLVYTLVSRLFPIFDVEGHDPKLKGVPAMRS